MRRCVWFTAGTMVLLAWTGLGEAGVYSTLEPKWTISGDYFRNFQEKSLTPLKQLTSADPNVVLMDWQRFAHLAASNMMFAKDPLPKGKGDAQEFEQLLNSAVCLLRVREPGKGMPEKANLILRLLSNRDRDNFLVMSTQANAHFALGEYRAAEGILGDAWRYWGNTFKDPKEPWLIINNPVAWEAACAKSFQALKPERKEYLEKAFGWTAKDFAWFAKCELYQRQLVRLRLLELKSGPMSMSKAWERLDPLFDPLPVPPNYKPLRFVGDSGKFEPGKIAEAEKAKIPDDAVEVVQQLLIWTPDDLRLFWLLGELMNAKGDTESAKIVFDEFLGKFSQMPEFQGLKDEDPKTGQPVPIKPIKLLSKFTERHPELGNRLNMLIEHEKRQKESPEPSKDGPNNAESPPATPTPDEPKQTVGFSLDLDWRTLGVGLGGGAIVGFFAAWRLRDILRRRQMR